MLNSNSVLIATVRICNFTRRGHTGRAWGMRTFVPWRQRPCFLSGPPEVGGSCSPHALRLPCKYLGWHFASMSMALSLAWPMSFPLLALFCQVQRMALLGFLLLSGSLHICCYWSVSFFCQVCLGKFYFPKLACHFCLWRNFMSSPHLIHLTILFSSDSGLLLCPQVMFFNIKVHHPWLPRLKGVGERQTKSTSLKRV